MPQKHGAERLRLNRRCAITIASFNALGLILVIASPMIVDPRLTTHVQFRERHYGRWVWLLVILAVPVFAVTWKLLENQRVSSVNYLRAMFPLVVPASIIAAFVFPPERPHLGALLLISVYASLSGITVACRQAREGYRYLSNPKLEFQGRLERLKATVSTWQQISIYAMATYIGFVAVVLAVLWTITDYQVTSKAERFFLGETFIFHMVIISFCMTVGPLHECFGMAFEAVRKLSSIKEHIEKQE